MMKLNRRHFTVLAGASLLAAPAIRASAAEITLKLGHLANEPESRSVRSMVGTGRP